jgi:hypothetical protein
MQTAAMQATVVGHYHHFISKKNRNPPSEKSPAPQIAAIRTRLHPPRRHAPFLSRIAPKHASPAIVGVPTCTRLSLGSSPMAATIDAAIAPAGTTHAGQTITKEKWGGDDRQERQV